MLAGGEIVAVIAECLVGTCRMASVDRLHHFIEGRDFCSFLSESQKMPFPKNGERKTAAYDFVEGRDFVVFPEIGEKSGGGRPAKEYAISLGFDFRSFSQ